VKGGSKYVFLDYKNVCFSTKFFFFFFFVYNDTVKQRFLSVKLIPGINKMYFSGPLYTNKLTGLLRFTDSKYGFYGVMNMSNGSVKTYPYYIIDGIMTFDTYTQSSFVKEHNLENKYLKPLHRSYRLCTDKYSTSMNKLNTLHDCQIQLISSDNVNTISENSDCVYKDILPPGKYPIKNPDNSQIQIASIVSSFSHLLGTQPKYEIPINEANECQIQIVNLYSSLGNSDINPVITKVEIENPVNCNIQIYNVCCPANFLSTNISTIDTPISSNIQILGLGSSYEIKNAVDCHIQQSCVDSISTCVKQIDNIDTQIIKLDSLEIQNLKPTRNDIIASCLLKGTKLLTPDGYRNIEDLKVGDYIVSNLAENISILKIASWTLNWHNNLEILDSRIYKIPSGKYGTREDTFITGLHRIRMDDGSLVCLKDLGLSLAEKAEICDKHGNYTICHINVENWEKNDLIINGICLVESWSGV